MRALCLKVEGGESFMMRLLLLVVCFISTCYCYVDYSGDVVLRVTAANPLQLGFIKALEQKFDLWHEARSVGDYADVHVPKQQVADAEILLQEMNIEYHTMIEDVGELILNERKTKDNTDNTRLDFYRTLEQVEEWIDATAAAFPNLVTVSTMATSYEGRPIRVIRISTGAGKPAFWMDSGIHAREWVAPAANIYYTERLLNGYGSDDEITALMEGLDFYVVPVFNVDGYAYTFTNDRLWRKTRSPNQGSSCLGTDPNRNWDIMWGEVAAGGPCTQTFPGSGAFSEVEVRDVAAYMAGIDNVVGVLAIHSYGQMYMVSYGYTNDNNPDYDEQMTVCNDAIDALKAVHGQTYRCDSLINLVGPNSGSSADYTYVVLGIKFSFGVELRDTGTFGFVLPENQIIPTGEENFEAVKVIAKAALDDLP